MSVTNQQKSAFGHLPEFFEDTLKIISGLVNRHREVVLDPDGTVLTWNRDFEEQSGYLAAEAIGKKIGQLFSGLQLSGNPDKELFCNGLKTLDLPLKNKGRIRVIFTPIKKDGELLGHTAILKKLGETLKNNNETNSPEKR